MREPVKRLAIIEAHLRDLESKVYLLENQLRKLEEELFKRAVEDAD